MIRLEQLRKTFDDGATVAVAGVDLTVADGELLVLLGESGCGKTTTLKMINRLIEPTSGRVLVNDVNVQSRPAYELRREIGYVFQRIGLFPHLSVAENVAIVPRLLGWKPADIAQRVDELLELVNLDPGQYRDRLPRELSGGQQQRVGLARALAARPGIMLMDEPFGALDPLTRDNLQEEFRRLHESLGLTTVMVTHDMTEALLLADRIAVMKCGQLVTCDTPRAMLAGSTAAYAAQLMAMPRRQADAIEALIAGKTDGGKP